MKNYFTDEQVKELAKQYVLLFQYQNDGYLQKLNALMNLAVDKAIGDPVGNVFINKDIVGVSFHSPLKKLENNQMLYSVKELEN